MTSCAIDLSRVFPSLPACGSETWHSDIYRRLRSSPSLRVCLVLFLYFRPESGCRCSRRSLGLCIVCFVCHLLRRVALVRPAVGGRMATRCDASQTGIYALWMDNASFLRRIHSSALSSRSGYMSRSSAEGFVHCYTCSSTHRKRNVEANDGTRICSIFSNVESSTHVTLGQQGTNKPPTCHDIRTLHGVYFDC